MSIVGAEGLSMAYGAQDILSAIAFTIAAGDRIGLVGPNGTGKTTLLRLITGIERPTAGSLTRARGLKLAYVAQQSDLVPGQTVYEEVAAVFADLRRMEDELLLAAEDLAQAGAGTEVASERYEELSLRFEHAGGYTYEADIRRTLHGLGIPPALWMQSVDGLSGGERNRVALAKAILERPDLLLLDEPTNHLDLQGIAWLENLLKGWRGSFIVVSHDRYFLDQVVNQIWESGGRSVQFYPGNYRAYERLRNERHQRQEFEYEQQRELIAKQEELIRRYGEGQRAKWAKGLEKRLDRVERIDAPKKVAKVKLNLGRALRSGRVVLTLENLCIPHPGDPERELLRLPRQVEIERACRVAIIGPNGCGKTTLLRTIAGEVPPGDGLVRIGYNVHMAYYRQGTEHLDEEATILNELLESRNLPLAEARNLLARFLFRGDDILKRVGMLSGGERSRLALAKLSVSGANFLLLDEPTNHLDIAAQEALEQVLSTYDGTLLVVSHDRRFIDSIATDLWPVEDGRLTPFHGTYSDYVASRDRPQSPPQAPPTLATSTPSPSRQRKAAEQHVNRLEETVGALETLLSDIGRQLEAASGRQDTAEIARLGELYVETETSLASAMQSWENAAVAAR
ncbi:MAG: ABC-F family ATP-binding cassette domain-containing protein [Dehalococcoidia bacterium]